MRYSFYATYVNRVSEALIYKELSYANPIAIVEYDKGTGVKQVLIHESIIDKVNYCKGGKELMRKLYRLVVPGGMTSVPEKSLSQVVKLVKKIKYAEFKERYKGNTRVTVQIIKIK